MDLTVDLLDKEGYWKHNGKPIEKLKGPYNEDCDVIIILKNRDANGDVPKKCHNCSSKITDADLLILTKHGWVTPCRSCEMFIWFLEGAKHD